MVVPSRVSTKERLPECCGMTKQDDCAQSKLAIRGSLKWPTHRWSAARFRETKGSHSESSQSNFGRFDFQMDHRLIRTRASWIKILDLPIVGEIFENWIPDSVEAPTETTKRERTFVCSLTVLLATFIFRTLTGSHLIGLVLVCCIAIFRFNLQKDAKISKEDPKRFSWENNSKEERVWKEKFSWEFSKVVRKFLIGNFKSFRISFGRFKEIKDGQMISELANLQRKQFLWIFELWEFPTGSFSLGDSRGSSHEKFPEDSSA